MSNSRITDIKRIIREYSKHLNVPINLIAQRECTNSLKDTNYQNTQEEITSTALYLLNLISI